MREFQKCIIVLPCYSGAHRRRDDSARINGSCLNSIHMECPIEDVRTTCNRSSCQDSSLEDEKVNKVGRPSSFRHSICLVQTQTKRNLAATSQSRERKQMENESGRGLSDQSSPSTRQRNAILADEISRHDCMQLFASRLHLQGDLSKRRTNFIRKTLQLRPAPKIVLNLFGNRSSSTTTSQTLRMVQLQQASGNRCEKVWNQLTKQKNQSLKSISEMRELPKMRS